jgi:hypothetical protein
LDETLGLRIFDMDLLCPLRIIVGHKQTSSGCLRRNQYTQMRPHAAHHTLTVCRRKVADILDGDPF